MIGSRTMYYVVCDLCGNSQEMDEIVAWTDEESAKEVALDSGWTLKNGKHYCPSHWICEAPQCHVEVGPLAGEFDYRCGRHQEEVIAETNSS